MAARSTRLTIALGLVIGALAASFVSLGFWQLRRLDERRAFNATLTVRTSLPVADITSLVPDPTDPPANAAYRRVSATGVYDPDDEVVVVGRSRNTLAGNHVVTPLLVGGTELMVNRGWVPLEDSHPPIARAAPPAGTVTVTGVLFPTQERGRFGPRHAPTGSLEQLHRIDLPRLAKQVDAPLYPWYLLIESQVPPQPGEYPQSIELPKLDEGPHLSYALQWFAFALIAVATFVAYIVQGRRRGARANP